MPAKKVNSYAHWFIRKYDVRIRGNTVQWICVNAMKPAKNTIKSNSQCIHKVKVTYDGKYKWHKKWRFNVGVEGINTKIRLIILFASKDMQALYNK